MLKKHLLRTKKRLTFALIAGSVLVVALFPLALLRTVEVQWHIFWPMVSLGPILEAQGRLFCYVVVALGQASEEATVLSLTDSGSVRLSVISRWLAGLYGLRVSEGGRVLQLRRAPIG